MKPEKLVLLLDDDEAIAEAISEILKTEGYQVICAENGKKGLEVLSQGVRPDIILVDLMMPVMNGMEFLEILRDSPRWKDLKVAVVSADQKIDQTFANVSDHPSIKGFLKKPMDIDQLLAFLDQATRDVA